jgi:(2R)-3-sulfolactate dehydrogenase (NADP+)
MCAALAGGKLGPQVGSFTEDDGKPVAAGQFFIALDPKAFSGGLFHRQIKALIQSIVSQKGARLPNARREANIKRLSKQGLKLDRALYETLRCYA